MLPATIDGYGGPYQDAEVVANPLTQISADNDNRALEDCAQMTNTADRACVRFVPVGSGNPTVAEHRTVWGNGALQEPVITRTGVGLYTLTFATTYTDALSYVETVGLTMGTAVLGGDTVGMAMVDTIVANVVTVRLFNGSNAASDLGSSSHITVTVK